MNHCAPCDEARQGTRDDPLYAEARDLVLATKRPSASMVQRHLCIAYSHAMRLLAAMEGDILGPPDGAGVRPLLTDTAPTDNDC